MFENPRRGQASKKFYNKCSENSRSQIVFRTDIFPKIVVGCPCKVRRTVYILTPSEFCQTRLHKSLIGKLARHFLIFSFFDRTKTRPQTSKTFWKKCSENSRSQIVFRTDIFRKLSLGAPGKEFFF